jgi:hypothetical protein
MIGALVIASVAVVAGLGALVVVGLCLFCD